MTEEQLKNEFLTWAFNGRINSENPKYVFHAIDILESGLDNNIPNEGIGNLFRYNSLDSFTKKVKEIELKPNFYFLNKKDGNGRIHAALTRYLDFLKQKETKKSNELTKGVTEMSKVEELAKLLENTHNLILHGAPGTGKTYLAKDIAGFLHFGKCYSELSDSEKEELKEYTGFVQFHPSYDYTDFVEGLRPVNGANGGQISFERKDGVFKKFCERTIKKSVIDFLSSAYDGKRDIKAYREGAYNKYKDNYSFSITSINEDGDYIKIQPIGGNHGTMLSEIDLKISYLISLVCLHRIVEGKDDVRRIFQDIPDYSELYYFTILREIENTENNSFIFIIDEINRGELSKIFGELFFSIDPGYRGEDGLVQTQYQNLVSEGDIFKKGFYVPENVYIIGTMNDIDRSVESMDLAMRRRFTFKEITAEDSSVAMLTRENKKLKEANITDEEISEMKKRMKNLNDKIVSADIGLSSAYQIGAAYFLKYVMYKEEQNPFECLWNYNLEGLLREYLRGQGNSTVKEKMKKLKEAYDE